MGRHWLHVQKVWFHLRQKHLCGSTTICGTNPQQGEEICGYCGMSEKKNQEEKYKNRIWNIDSVLQDSCIGTIHSKNKIQDSVIEADNSCKHSANIETTNSRY